jgi:putative transposase
MSRHTAFRYCLDPTVEQQTMLARHAGAARFAYNQCLAMVKTALTQRRTDPEHPVPWTRFDLINTFNTWKKSAAAGRIFTVDPTGVTTVEITGLAWRNQVCQQVFEEAATDCGRGLAGWSDSCSGTRRGPKVGFPRFKKKTTSTASFRLRNKHARAGRSAIRIGDDEAPRSVTLPGLGQLRVREDTRRLRRMLTARRAKILSATVSERAGRWWISVTVEAADLHPGQHHPARVPDDSGGWVGIDRGLSAFLVAANAEGREVARIDDPPKPLARGLARQRRLAKAVSRKEKGSRNPGLTLSDRVCTCTCGYRADRDLNAAVNLAAWPALHRKDPPRSPDLRAGGRATNARRREGTDRYPRGAGATGPDDAGTKAHAPAGA